jgi:predicted Zn-dependent peptidase
MIDNLIGLFDNITYVNPNTNTYNYDILVGGSNESDTSIHNKRKNKISIKKTNYLIYTMEQKNDNISDSISSELAGSDQTTDKQLNSDNSSKLMKSLLIPLLNSNTITVGIFINAGSRHETEAFGIAHFLEHMTFKGTNKQSSDQLMVELDSLGANYNAMTGHEFTAYYISGDPRDIEKFLDIIIDLYLNPTFPESDITKERNVVLEEQRMNEDSSGRLLSNSMFKEMYGEVINDLARPIIGFPETISAFNRSDIINYRNKNYIGSNCLLCVSGNFDTNDVIKFIEHKFNAKLIKQPKQKDLFFNTIKKNTNFNLLLQSKSQLKQHINLYKDIKQTIINFTFGSLNTNNYYLNHLDLLADILSNGFSSRLFNLLRNKMGVSYYNNSFVRTFEDCGQFVITVGVEHNSVISTIEGILNELKNIKTDGILEAELSKAKKQNETSLLFQFKDPYEYLMYYGMNYLKAKPMYNITDMLENIDSVKLDELNALVRKIFVSNNLIIGTIGKVNDSDSETIINLIQQL